MKKIIFMIMLLPNIAFAEVIYTDYKEYLRDTTTILEESDLLKKEEQYLYNTYKEELDSFYAPKDNIYEGYKVDYDNYIIEEKYSIENNIYSTNYQIKCENKNYFVAKIILTNFSNNLKLSEVNVMHNTEKLQYGVGIENHTGNKFDAINKEIYDKDISIDEDTIIRFTFFYKIKLEDLKINLYFNEKLNKNTTFKILIDEKESDINFNLPYEEKNHIVITFDNDYNEFLKENNFELSTNCLSYHTLKIPNYYNSKINIIPLNIYKPINNIDKFLTSDYIKKYTYYKRDKIEISDNIILENEKFNPAKFINSTVPIENLQIVDNINYKKTGTYIFKIYYDNKLLTEKNIYYTYNQPIQKDNTTKVKKTTKYLKKITKKILKTTEKQTNKKLVLNISNKTEEKIFSHKNIHIIIISVLLIVLIIFEIILLYVKKKYF